MRGLKTDSQLQGTNSGLYVVLNHPKRENVQHYCQVSGQESELLIRE